MQIKTTFTKEGDYQLLIIVFGWSGINLIISHGKTFMVTQLERKEDFGYNII